MQVDIVVTRLLTTFTNELNPHLLNWMKQFCRCCIFTELFAILYNPLRTLLYGSWLDSALTSDQHHIAD